MSEFHTVCKFGDLKEGEGKTVAIGHRVVALFLIDGQLSAIDDTCPHMGASLAGGHVENKVVTCPWHAWRFCVSDGTWADNRRLKIGSYPVKVEGDDILIAVEPKPKKEP